MKKLKIISILIIILSFINCTNNDDIEEAPSKLPDLKQTAWKGTLITKTSGQITDNGEVSILFLTENRGNSVVVKNGRVQKWDFKYTTDNKLLTIEQPFSSINLHLLEGDWILTEIEVNRLVLVQGLNDEYKQMIMDIYKVE